MTESKTGGCLCGGVRYRIDGPVRDIVGCHCTQCRKTTGHFLASAQVWTEDFVLEKQDTLKWYRASDYAGRGFCDTCGASLIWAADDWETLSVLAGTLDDPGDLKMQGHIFTATKGTYFDLEPGLPAFEEDDNGAFPMPERRG